MRELPIVCPAGAPAHPPAGSPGVLCGELALTNDGAHVRGFSERGQVSPLISGDEDRTVIGAYCCGPGITGAINSYAACPVWRAAREADWARRGGFDRLRDTEAARPPAIDPELREALSPTAGV